MQPERNKTNTPNIIQQCILGGLVVGSESDTVPLDHCLFQHKQVHDVEALHSLDLIFLDLLTSADSVMWVSMMLSLSAQWQTPPPPNNVMLMPTALTSVTVIKNFQHVNCTTCLTSSA